MSFTMPLSPGAIWRGSQTSGQASYEVEVRICGIDDHGDISGTLTIRNLTPSLPKLVTLFDGEVIGENHSILTSKWGATEEDDKRHWARFKRDLGLKGVQDLNDDLVINMEDVVFMRLKERCIINAEKESDISGASFSGFYYIAVNLNATPSATGQADFKSARSPAVQQSASYNNNHTMNGHRQNSEPHHTRTGSYASAVRGSGPATLPIDIIGSVNNAHKNDENVNVAITSITSGPFPAPYSPSFEEFPVPPSPSPSSQRHSDFPFGRLSGLFRNISEGSPTYFNQSINLRTGYTGPWAHATMRGFYFASSNDPYQELELTYVGDGMGARLEENCIESLKTDDWRKDRSVCMEGLLDLGRYQKEWYLQPKGSASFTLL